jgi:hypothetical protein
MFLQRNIPRARNSGFFFQPAATKQKQPAADND